MLEQFVPFWALLATIFNLLPYEVTMVGSFVFCAVGVIGVFRSL